MQMKTTSSAKADAIRSRAKSELRDFADKGSRNPMMSDLYRRAEADQKKQKQNQNLKTAEAKSEADPQRLLHELQVHQIELQLQNAELQNARDELETALEKYTDLYDFAPVGYFTLDPGGNIRLVNLTGAHLVGVERSKLMGQPFGHLITGELRPAFNSFLKKVFAGMAKQAGDFEIAIKGQPPRAVNIEAQRSPNGQSCRVAVVDITERKLVEHEVLNKARLLDLSHDAIIVRDVEGRIRYWNHGAEELYGWSREEALGKLSHILLKTKYLTPFKKMIAELQSTGRWVGELVHTNRDGRRLTVMARKTLDHGSNGDPAVVLENITDITERKLVEAQVRVSEIRYRRLFETAHDGVLLLNPVTRKITDANPFMTKLLGYPHEQLVGKELFEIGLLKDGVASREMFEKLKRNHEVRYEDLPLESQGGRHQEVEVVENLYEESGHPVIQSNIRDITQRKQSEEMLRRNEALFSSLIEQSPVGMYVVDARMCLQQVNPKALPVFSKVRPLKGRNLSEVMHILWPKKTAGEVMGHFRHTLKTGKPYISHNFSERRSDIGVTEFYEWQIQRITLPAGEHGVVCFFSNITERKQAEETLRRVTVLAASNRKLELEIVRRQAVEESLKQSEQHQRLLLKQSHLMQEQLRNLSRQVLHAQEEERKRISRELHDVIAQTLTGINIRLATLKKSAGTDSTGFAQNIARTQQLVEHSVEIVHQFARELRPAVLDDLGLIPALHSFMKTFTTQTGVRTRLTAFAAVEKLEAPGRTVLFRIAQEALTNVARHAKANHVEVSIEKSADGICMKIKDDGKSFSVEGVSDAKGRKRLGLLGMRERLEMIGGNFSVESAPGQGTTIIAKIPAGKTGGGR